MVTDNKLFFPIGGSVRRDAPMLTQMDEARSRLYRLEQRMSRILAWAEGESLTELTPGPVDGIIHAGAGLTGGGDLRLGSVTIDTGEGPWIDVTSNAVGVGADKVLRVFTDGSPAQEYDTIAAGLSGMSAGDVVLCPPGTYSESVTIPAGGILLGMPGATISQGTVTLSSNSAIYGMEFAYTANTADAIRAIYASLDVLEVAYVRHCKIRMANEGTGQTDGIHIEGYSCVFVHDCEIEVWGFQSSAIHSNTVVGTGGAALSGTDVATSGPVLSGECITDSVTDGIATVILLLEPDEQNEQYSYFRVRFGGKACSWTDWGLPPSTPARVEMQRGPWPSPGWQPDLEYYNAQTQAWQGIGVPSLTLITYSLINLHCLGGGGTAFGRIRKTPARPTGQARILAEAKVDRSMTLDTSIITLCWDQVRVGSYVEDCVLFGEADDLYVEEGGIEVHANDYNPGKVVGPIEPRRGDRAVWDVNNYPSRHAIDLRDERSTAHLPPAEALNDLVRVDNDGYWSVLSGPDAEGEVLIAGVNPFVQAWALLDAQYITGLLTGTGTEGRLAQWAAGGASIEDSTLIKSGAGVLTLDAGSAYTLTVPATGTTALGTGAANRVAYWSGTNALTSSEGLFVDVPNNLFLVASGGGIAAGFATTRLLFYAGGAVDYAQFSDCYVGIGGIPGTQLDVVGSIRVQGATPPPSGAGLELSYVGGIGYVTSYNRTTSAYLPLVLRGDDLIFREGTAEIMRIAGGKVGIGIPVPTSRLHVADDYTTVTAGRNVYVQSTWTPSGAVGVVYPVGILLVSRFDINHALGGGFASVFRNYAYSDGSTGISTYVQDLRFENTGTGTVPMVRGILIRPAVNSGGGAITTIEGILIQAQTVATNIRGVRSQIAAAANRHNLYLDGTAQSYLAGSLGVGIVVPTAKAHVDQASTTAAIPTLLLDQADLSEEFIEFTATVGAGNPIDTAAIGSYYGKIRVNITGVGYKYIALYNS